MCNFYRRFLPNCADLLQLLADLLEIDKTLAKPKIDYASTLRSEARTAFGKTKSIISNVTMLQHLDTDPTTHKVLCIDAS